MFTLCAIAKNENRYLREWVSFHDIIGFDKIVVYDNDSDTKIESDLAPGITSLEVRRWPTNSGVAPQLEAYADCLKLDGGASDWMMFLDLDEFLNLKECNSIALFVAEYPEADAIAINWRMFGSSGEVDYRPGFVTERFRQASTPQYSTNAHVKTIFRPSKIKEVRVHAPLMRDGAVLVHSSGRRLKPEENILVHDIDVNKAQVNHYFVKSAREFETKRLRGRGDVAEGDEAKRRSSSEFSAEDRNDMLDESILRFWSVQR